MCEDKIEVYGLFEKKDGDSIYNLLEKYKTKYIAGKQIKYLLLDENNKSEYKIKKMQGSEDDISENQKVGNEKPVGRPRIHEKKEPKPKKEKKEKEEPKLSNPKGRPIKYDNDKDRHDKLKEQKRNWAKKNYSKKKESANINGPECRDNSSNGNPSEANNNPVVAKESRKPNQQISKRARRKNGRNESDTQGDNVQSQGGN